MNIRLTEKRQRILSLLKRRKRAMSAKEIHTTLPEIDLVTIYRNLELFTKEKLITELHLGGGEARYEYQHEPHHHAVCKECEKIIHFIAPDEKIKQILGLADFKVDQIEVTVRGVCQKPAKKS